MLAAGLDGLDHAPDHAMAPRGDAATAATGDRNAVTGFPASTACIRVAARRIVSPSGKVVLVLVHVHVHVHVLVSVPVRAGTLVLLFSNFPMYRYPGP